MVAVYSCVYSVICGVGCCYGVVCGLFCDCFGGILGADWLFIFVFADLLLDCGCYVCLFGSGLTCFVWLIVLVIHLDMCGFVVLNSICTYLVSCLVLLRLGCLAWFGYVCCSCYCCLFECLFSLYE